MKRLWVAAALAVGFHVVLLNLNGGETFRRRVTELEQRPVILTLAARDTTVPNLPPPASPVKPNPALIPKAELPRKPEPVKTPKAKPKLRTSKPDTTHSVEVKSDVPDPPVESAGLPSPSTAEPAENIPRNQTPSMDIPKAPVQTVPKSEPPIREAAPMVDQNPPPEYPQQARKRGFQGLVLLRVLVGVNGEVMEVRMHESSGHEILDRIAEETVWKWKFQPGYRGEEPLEMWIRVPIRFELK